MPVLVLYQFQGIRGGDCKLDDTILDNTRPKRDRTVEVEILGFKDETDTYAKVVYVNFISSFVI